MSSRMKGTAFLLVFGVLLTFCWAQVPTSDALPCSLQMFTLTSVFQPETEVEDPGAEEEHVELFTTAKTKMAAATSDFGYNLFRALAGQEVGKNVFLSPISVSAVLTQLSMGDHTNTQTMKHTPLSGAAAQGRRNPTRCLLGPRRRIGACAESALQGAEVPHPPGPPAPRHPERPPGHRQGARQRPERRRSALPVPA